MILSNNVPNAIWDSAMGNRMGVRFPPGSWDRGGGGYMGYNAYTNYGLSKQAADEVVVDVLAALNRAAANIDAQIAINQTLDAKAKAELIAAMIQIHMQITTLGGDMRASVNSGHMTLDQWNAAAQPTFEQLKAAASAIGDSGLVDFLDGVSAGATGAESTGGLPGWAIALGLVGAAFLGYKLLKK